MYIAISFMIIGLLIGRILRKKVKFRVSVLIFIVVCILLFILGLETGFNRELFKSLPTLGLSAFIIAVSSVLGSIILVKIFTKTLLGSKDEK